MARRRLLDALYAEHVRAEGDMHRRQRVEAQQWLTMLDTAALERGTEAAEAALRDRRAGRLRRVAVDQGDAVPPSAPRASTGTGTQGETLPGSRR